MAKTTQSKKYGIMFSLYINTITIKGGKVTLDNGATKVHMALNNLDAKSRYSALAGKGYVNLNTYYAARLFGWDADPVRKVKDYRKPEVKVVPTYVGPAVYFTGKDEHIEMRKLVEQAAINVEGIASFERGWQRAYKQLTKERSSAASGAHKPTFNGADEVPTYIETQFLKSKGVANLAIAA